MIVKVTAVNNLTENISRDKKRVKPGRESAHINGRGELDLSVMALAEQRSVEQTAFGSDPD